MFLENKKVANIEEDLLNNFWFAPSDVLQRGTEAVIWHKQKLKGKILSIGCADSLTDSFIFPKDAAKATAIDLNEEAIKRAEKIDYYDKVLQANAEELPFKNGLFETIVSNSTFEHIKSDTKSVKEAFRVLKNGGKFIITVPYQKFKENLKACGVKNDELNKLNKRLEHKRYRSKKEWVRIFKRAGFKKVETKTYIDKNTLYLWYKLHKFTTFKPFGKRELWSLIQTNKVMQFILKPLFILILKRLIKKHLGKDLYIKNGSHLLIKGVK